MGRLAVLLQFPQALQGGKDFVADLRLHRDEVEGRHADGAAGAHALPGHVEQLPVEVEALFRTHEIARQHELHQQLLSHGQRIHLLHGHGQLHQRTRRPHHQRRHARQPRGNGIRQRVAVQGGFARLSEVLEGQHENRILLLLQIGRLAKALCQHGEKSRCPFLALSRRH